MFMQFDSIEEFREMAEAMGYVREGMQSSEMKEWRAAMSLWRATNAVALAELEEAQGNEPAPTEQPVSTGTTNPQSQPESSEKPKRTRRTKAEMEAARAADASSSIASETFSASAAPAEQASTSANPFEANTSNASAATQAILSAPTGQAATLAGIAAMQANPFDPNASADNAATGSDIPAAQSATSSIAPALATSDASSYIEARSLELLTNGEPITPVSHMHKCREFIGKHGQAKYVETFPLATLPMTVATFKPDQCARHQAAMEFAAQSNV